MKLIRKDLTALSSNMTDEWNSIPNDVLLNIVNSTDCNDSKQTQWMQVNKQWLNVHHSAIYKSVTINFNHNFDDYRCAYH
jgi:hypothetical protein